MIQCNPEAAPTALVVERIEVASSYLEVRVRIADAAHRSTASVPGLADRAFHLLPGLSRHSCSNGRGLDFRREAADTETAHLYEHITCELMALSGSPRDLRSSTAWDFAADGEGVYRLTIAFDDDLVAIAALKEALTVVEWLLGPGGAEAPDIDAAVGAITAVRAR